MITDYSVNVLVEKDVHWESLLTSFGKTSSQIVSHSVSRGGLKRIKNIWLESSLVTDLNPAQKQAQALYNAHNVVAAVLAASKAALVTTLYNAMNSEVYSTMSVTFGTTNGDSASAYERTWNMMLATPADWSAQGLKASFAVGGLTVGAALDTNQKVIDYATAKLAEVKTYGIWRMVRIEQFRADRAAALA